MKLNARPTVYFVALALLAFTPALSGQTLPAVNTLYSFTGGTDGDEPVASLVQGSDGSFYGTTTGGGDGFGDGTVFRITSTGHFTSLHEFKDSDTDGALPQSALVEGGDGKFYGTTLYGGANFKGTVFSMTLTGVITLLHSFTAGSDGSLPQSALVRGSNGVFYGTTSGGGSSGYGTVFSITAAGVLTTLHNFTRSGKDGAVPMAALVQIKNGILYGTTAYGGTSDNGTIFSMTPAGVLTTLHSFTGTGTDGSLPRLRSSEAATATSMVRRR